MKDQFWQPDKETRSSILKGNRKDREFHERLTREREEKRRNL